jgi:hypothetical protein
MIVILSKDEIQFCTQAAIQRWLIKFGSTDRPNYAEGKINGKLEHELIASIRTLVAEWAVAKHFNLTWTFPVYPNELHGKRSHLPDVGVNGEVRTIRTQSGIPYWSKDSYKVIYGAKVLDSEYFKEVKLFAPFNARESMKDEYRDESIQGWRMPIHLIDLGSNPCGSTS